MAGTTEELILWTQFFNDFVSVPEFSLRDYIEWSKGYGKPKH